MPDAPRIPSGQQVAYYSSWETDTWQCRCGWLGTGEDAAREAFDALLQVDCPACGGRLCLVIYPSTSETKAAAKAGNEEALRAIGAAGRRKLREAAFKKTKLVRASQLPPLEGIGEIDFLLWCDEKSEDQVYILEANGEEVHREQAWFEDNDPLRRYCHCVTQRYGDRVRTFTIDTTAFIWLVGDSLSLYHEQAGILEEFGLVQKQRDTLA